jgi:ABC-type multidrug transport system fused ATPase/permease subunit
METLTGIQLIKATANEEKEYRRLLQAIENCEKADFLAQANSAAIAPLSEVMSLFAILLIVGLGNVFFPTQIASLSAILLTYLFLLFRLLPLIAQLNGFRSKFANRASSIKAVNEFLRRDNKPFSKNGNCHYVPIAQGIHFDGVSFAYGDRAPQVLDGIDLQLYRGETLALVGASGAGKSTVAKLLPRFYNPTAGKITLDGRDLREFDVKSLRKAMGIVSQETVLFNESVFENIAYGKPHATEAEVIEAAKQAKAYEFIVELPQGFQTKIGDRGICLSGGQRQRLAIARTLLQDPDILILDEATSALDAISERAIREAIENLSRNRTTLAIAHRLSAVQNADRIAVLDKGRIVEIGTHDQLLARGGHYTQLYRMQCETA